MAFDIPQPHPHHTQHLSLTVAFSALALTLAYHFLLAGVYYGFPFIIFGIMVVALMHLIAALSGRGGNTWAYIFLAPAVLGVVAEATFASLVVRVVAFLLTASSLAFFAYWRTSPSISFWEVRNLFPVELF